MPFTDSLQTTTSRLGIHKTAYRVLLCYLLVALAAGAYLFPFVGFYSHKMDEGILLQGALRVSRGEVPARDFVETIGPGGFYWLALFFKVFGPTMGTARGLMLATGVSVAVMIFYLARRVGASPGLCAALFLVTAIPKFPINSYHLDGNAFCILSLCLLMEWLRTGRTWLLIGCGCITGFATLITQSKGALFFIALSASLLILRPAEWRRWILPVSLPFTAVLTMALLLYSVLGALKQLVWANLVWPASRYVSSAGCPYGMLLGAYLGAVKGGLALVMPSSLASLLAFFIGLPFLLVTGLPLIVIVCIVQLRSRTLTARLVPVACCGAALWISELQRPDLQHLIWGSPIGLIFLLALFDRYAWYRNGVRPLCWVTVGLLGSLLALPALTARIRIETRRGTLRALDNDKALEFLLQHTRRGDYAFVYPYFPLYNFLTDTRSPTRCSYYVYGWNTREQFIEAVADLKTKKARYVLWSADTDPKFLFPRYRQPAYDEQAVERYLEQQYRQIGLENGFRIMERQDSILTTAHSSP